MNLRQLQLAAAVVMLAALTMAQRPAPKLTINHLVQIKHPSGHQWSPDGQRVWWTYNDGGINNVWTVAADGRGAPVALTNYADGQSGAGGFWSLDGQTFFYQRGGGLLAVPATGGAPKAAWPSAARASSFVLSPDGTRVAFVVGPDGGATGSDLIVHTIATGKDTNIAHVAGRIGGAGWSPDSTRLAFATAGTPSTLLVADVSDTPRTQTIVSQDGAAITGVSWTPDGANLLYTVGGSVGAPIQHQVSPPEIGNKIIFVAFEGGPGSAGQNLLVPASGGTPKPTAGRGGGGRGAWLDPTHIFAVRTSNGGKTRTAESIDIHGGPPTLLREETVDKFFSSINGTASAISPDRRWLLFTADTTGWDQIYVMPTSGGAITQVTKAPGEHWRAVWSNDSRRIAWDANTAEKPGDRHIQFATIGDDPARATITTVTSGTGTNTIPRWSPDDTRLLYQHTDAQYSGELYVSDAASSAKMTRLTSSMPAAIDRSVFVAPQFVRYPGPDGKSVPAWLFVPKNLDRTTKHAAIVWIHPDGVNMNYNGFHPDRNEAVYYEFHQYLLQQGYVVIAPDYRGSIGYGRDWRNGVYMDVGGNDAKDARMAAGYLKSLGYVDPERIGVWGLSLGGFFTLQAITQEPTLFRAAVDVAAPGDWALYYEDPYHGGWTTSRMGTPQENPDIYAKASPISHVDQIQRPLMILGGTADVNVPFLHNVLLVDRLLKAGKGHLLSFMMYPGESHYFDRSFVVRDAWQRVDAFFRQHLQPQRATK